MIKEILESGHPQLRQRCQAVEEIDREVLKTITDLKDTLLSAKDPEGVGLSAPQIGVGKRIIIVKKIGKDRQEPGKIKTTIHVLINPEISNASTKKEKSFEGCLSVPGKYGWVLRSPKIKVKALDERGNPIKFSAKKIFAYEIQHEIDHLDGILFTDKLVGKLYDEEELDILE